MPAPTYGDQYMQIAPPLVSSPANAAEATNFDAAFETAWAQVQELCPLAEDGDYAFKAWAANLAYRYKTGGTFLPAITSLSPNTGVHAVTTSVTVTGTNFDASAVVVVAGLEVVSAAHSPTTITFSLPGAMIPTAGTYGVQVKNSNGQISTASNFTAT